MRLYHFGHDFASSGPLEMTIQLQLLWLLKGIVSTHIIIQ